MSDTNLLHQAYAHAGKGCSHDTLEPNGHLPPKYQPMRCAKCKTPFTPDEVERLKTKTV